MKENSLNGYSDRIKLSRVIEQLGEDTKKNELTGEYTYGDPVIIW